MNHFPMPYHSRLSNSTLDPLSNEVLGLGAITVSLYLATAPRLFTSVIFLDIKPPEQHYCFFMKQPTVYRVGWIYSKAGILNQHFSIATWAMALTRSAMTIHCQHLQIAHLSIRSIHVGLDIASKLMHT
jgi:hypothetical protein